MSNLIIINGNVLVVGGTCGSWEQPVPIIVSPALLNTFFEGSPAVVRITLSDIQSQNVLVDYATSDGTAVAGTDYTAASGTATITPGNLFVDVSVTTALRAGVQGDRTFNFTISNARLADTTSVSIQNSTLVATIQESESEGGGPVFPTISVVPGVAVEGSNVGMQVRSTFAHTEDITFTYATSNGTAIAGTDYTTTNGTGTITAGQTSTTINVPTASRAGYQGSRSFSFTISAAQTDPSADPITIVTSSTNGIITDTEAPSGSHGFYEALIAKPEILGAEDVGYFSLRNTTSINTIQGTAGIAEGTWQYVGGEDEDPEAQDACKLVMFISLATAHQMRVPLGSFNLSTGQVLFTYDMYFTASNYTNVNVDGGLNHKFDNIMDGGPNSSGTSIYIEPRVFYRPGSYTAPVFGKRNLRSYGQGGNELEPFGLVRNTPYEPTGLNALASDTYELETGMWYRNWFELHMDKPGNDALFDDWNNTYNVSGNDLGTRNIVGTSYGAVNQVQVVELDELKPSNTDPGWFQLTILGETTVPIYYNDLLTDGVLTGAGIQTALENLTAFAPGDIIVRKQSGHDRYDVEFAGAYAGTTQALFTVTKYKAGTIDIIEKVAAGNYTIVETATADFWHSQSRPTANTNVTISGNSNPSLNGAKSAIVYDDTHLLFTGNNTGTGGVVSKHYNCFSWWSASEDAGPTRIIWRVPLIMRGDNKLLAFAFERNTSDKITQMRRVNITEPPSIANPTVLTVTGHTFSTGDRTVIKGSDVIPNGNYRVTVVDSNHISIPVEVTTTSALNTSGTYIDTYGIAFYPIVQYVRNFVGLRNITVSEADTSIFARPVP